MQTKRDDDKYSASNNKKFVVLYTNNFMYDLLNDAVSISDYIQSNGRMTVRNEREITRKEEM
jgi:hypothetical protein